MEEKDGERKRENIGSEENEERGSLLLLSMEEREDGCVCLKGEEDGERGEDIVVSAVVVVCI